MLLTVRDKWRLYAVSFSALTAFAGAVVLICGGWYAAGLTTAVLIAVGYGYTVHIYRETASGKWDGADNVNAPDGGQEGEQ